MSARRLILAVCFFFVVVNMPSSSGSPQAARPAKPAARYSDRDLLIAPDHTLVRDSAALVSEKKGKSRRPHARQRPARIAKPAVARHPRGQLREPVVRKADAELFSGQKTIYYKGEVPITIDYDKGVIIVNGEETPIIVDNGEWEDMKNSINSVSYWVNLNEVYYDYLRFQVYIDSDYYSGPHSLDSSLVDGSALSC